MAPPLPRPSRVIWETPTSFGGGRGARIHQIAAPAAIASAAATPAQAQRNSLPDSAMDALAALTLPEVVSRLRRVRSARRSAELWYRTSRSLSRALLIIRSTSAGRSGFARRADAGSLLRIELNSAAEVSPLKGSVPVDISYSTAPKENRS